MTARDDLARLIEQATDGPWVRIDHNWMVVRPPDEAEWQVARTVFGNDTALIVWLRNRADRLLALWEAAYTEHREHVPEPRPWEEEAPICHTCAALAALEEEK